MTEFYRFRSIEKLLKNPYEELEKQTVFFAGVKELNDPMEGFRNLVWDGDYIVWSSLLRHYVHCLQWTYIKLLLDGSDHTLGEGDIPIEERWDSDKILETDALMGEVWPRVRDECKINELAKRIAGIEFTGVRHKVRSSELQLYLQCIHLRVLSAMQDVFVHQGLLTEEQRIELPAISQSDNALLDPYTVVELLNQVEGLNDETADTIFFNVTSLFHNMRLRHRLAPQQPASKNATLLLFEFPQTYVEQLNRLLWPEWYAACFVKEYYNSSMWANYADAHRGICLIFGVDDEGQHPALHLRHPRRVSSFGNGDLPNASDFVAMAFQGVSYQSKPDEINFFHSMGRPTAPTLLELWYRDDDGHISECAEHVFGPDSNVDSWRDNYWHRFLSDACFKTTDWAYEKEYRLVLSSGENNALSARERALKYNFKSLKGIIFGMRTPDESKFEIIDIIERKCRENQRSDFQLFQAYYSPETGDIRTREISKFFIPPTVGK